MKPLSLFTISVFLLLSGFACAPLEPIRPIANGFHHALPHDQAPLVVWGDHSSAVDTATTWLLKRGYRVVEQAKLNEVFREQKITFTHTDEDTGRLLQVGKLLGANQVIFLDTDFLQHLADDTYSNAYVGRANSYALYDIGVSVRGIDIESEEIQWTGTATYSGGISNPQEGLGHLTRSALAKAWE
ncbi:MAG: hypothetical protein VST68_11080 [Nitrospirota bacterium]|nr:hypothetical protein [Nitrospirota bacterium]